MQAEEETCVHEVLDGLGPSVHERCVTHHQTQVQVTAVGAETVERRANHKNAVTQDLLLTKISYIMYYYTVCRKQKLKVKFDLF